jgi:hypothetical protein
MKEAAYVAASSRDFCVGSVSWSAEFCNAAK